MATIHCKACGKSYNYEKNGCCPECGAYNRPPRREQVYADGTVHHLDGSSRRPVPNGDKVCYEKKENHQKKVCFEDQARQVREKLNNLSRPARQVSLVGVLVAGLIVLSLVSSIVSSCQTRHPDYPVDPVTPATQEPAVPQDWLWWSDWQGGRVGLLGASYEDGTLQVELEIQRDPGDVLLDDFWLYCVDEDGQELTRAVSDASCQEHTGLCILTCPPTGTTTFSMWSCSCWPRTEPRMVFSSCCTRAMALWQAEGPDPAR